MFQTEEYKREHAKLDTHELESDFRSVMEPVAYLIGSVDDMIYTLRRMGFFTAPGSTKYHDNYRGGLYQHSKRVTLILVSLTHSLNLKWQRARSPYVIGMLHDLCKADSYIDRGTHFEYNNQTTLDGHGEKSVMLAHHLGLQLTDEEVHCIRWHMGAYEGEPHWKAFDAAIQQYPNVLYTHLADMIDAKGIHNSLSLLQTDEFHL